MTVSEFLTHVNYSLRATDDDSPTFGTDEANYWLATLNRVKNQLYNNARVLWDETWEVKSLGAVSAATSPTYNCDATLIAPSDQAYITDTNSQNVYYDVVRPKERTSTTRQVYIAGVNPKVLYFTNAITASEDIVGGTLYLPGYYMPADLTAEDDDLPLPDPYWAVMTVASEIAFNDIIYEDKAEGLNQKANSLYLQMLRNNRRSTYGYPKTNAHYHYRIKSTEVN